jgi:hypothetical protein
MHRWYGLFARWLMVYIRKEGDEKKETFAEFIRKYYDKIKIWVTPDPTDSMFMQIVKLISKSIALLILIAFSPIISVVLLFVFFAAV